MRTEKKNTPSKTKFRSHNNFIRLVMSVTTFCVRSRLIGLGKTDSKAELKEEKKSINWRLMSDRRNYKFFDKSFNVLRDVQEKEDENLESRSQL